MHKHEMHRMHKQVSSQDQPKLIHGCNSFFLTL